MDELLQGIADCIERGKPDKASLYPSELAGFEGADELTLKALQAGLPPERILSEGLIAGMSRVGELFRKGEIFLPDVLMSARAMTTGMAHLQPHFAAGRVKPRGKIVLGTVAGDIHDIGKRIVGLFFQGGGWEVIDIGVDVPTEKFLEAVSLHDPRAVGLSALLTTTMVNMEGVTRALKERHPGLLVIVGGAPVTQAYADRIGADAYSPDPQGALEFLASKSSETALPK